MSKSKEKKEQSAGDAAELIFGEDLQEAWIAHATNASDGIDFIAAIFALSHGQKSFTADDIGRISEWINQVFVDRSIWSLVRRGLITIDTRGGELLFAKATEEQTRKTLEAISSFSDEG